MHGTGKTKRKVIEKLSSELTEPAEKRSASVSSRCWVSTQFVCSIALALIIVFFISTGSALAEDSRRVLVLNSYHPRNYWTQVTMSGIESAFEDYVDTVAFDVEYMDTKRFRDRIHYENLYVLLKDKARSKRYDVIITNDNNALLFLLQYRRSLYPSVPVVFCGVDTFHCSMYEWRPSQCSIEKILQGNEQVTGVIEKLCYESTLATALRLHPSAKRMIFVNDGINEVTYWPLLTDADVAEIAKGYESKIEFSIFLLTEHNSDELLKEIQRKESETILLLTGNFLDEEGNLVLSQPSLSEFWSQCKVPVYSFTREMLEKGFILGGNIISSYLQGETAARMAIQILEGSNADEIGILQSSPAEYMFDYVRLKEFGISLSDLPEGSIVINQPQSFYYRYKGRIWAVILLIGVLTGMVTILSVNIIRRRTAEEALRESEERYRALFEGSAEGIIAADIETKKFKYVNPAICRMLGYTEEELTSMGVQDVHPKEDLERVISEFKAQSRGDKTLVQGIPCLRKDGTVIYADINTARVVIDGRECNVGFFTDITERKRGTEELKQYQYMVESANDAIFFKDLESRYVIANEKTLEAFGLSREQVIGKNDYEIMPNKEEAKSNIADDNLVFRKGKLTEVSKHMTGADGKEYWFQAIKVPQFDDKGQITGLVGIARDITEHKRAEQALRESRHRQTAILNTIPDIAWLKDYEGRFVAVNDALCKEFEIREEDLIGKTDFDVSPTDLAKRYKGDDKEVMKTGKRKWIEEQWGKKKGKRKWIETVKTPIYDDKGKIAGVSGIARDITLRKRSEESLRESEEKYRVLTENLRDVVVRISVDGTLQYCSPAIKQFAGYDSEDEIGNNISRYFVNESDLVKAMDLIKKISIEKSPAEDIEFLFEAKNKEPFYVEVTGQPLISDDEVSSIQCVMRDITERKQAEEKLQKARDELEIRVKQRTTDLAQAVKELEGQIAERKKAEEKLLLYQKELRSLASALSLAEERLRRRVARNVHDNIGQSLAMSKIKLESLRESITSPELVKLLQESCELLAKAIENSRSLTTELSPPVLYELGFEAALEWLVKNSRQQYGFSAEFKDDGENKPISDDISVMLFQAVRELLFNVAKHAKAKKVQVSVQLSDDQIQVAVEDDGVGFDILKHNSLDKRTSGFGLFSIHERLGHIGGRFNVESKLGSGTCVTLIVPSDVNKKEKEETKK